MGIVDNIGITPNKILGIRYLWTLFQEIVPEDQPEYDDDDLLALISLIKERHQDAHIVLCVLAKEVGLTPLELMDKTIDRIQDVYLEYIYPQETP